MKTIRTGHIDRTALAILVADITTLQVDAIVNAANAQLAGGGGVDGAIHRAAGPRLLEACRRIGGCPTGEARLTDGFALPARHVIHTVGPVWSGGDRGEDALLAAAYRASLSVATDARAASVAFPAISTGVYGFPAERAARIAVGTVADWLGTQPGALDEIVFCCFSDESADHHTAAFEAHGIGAAPQPR